MSKFNGQFNGSPTSISPAESGGVGIPGPPGPQGEPGISPTIQIQDIDGGHRVMISDAFGTGSFDVMDGKDGEPGPRGFSPIVSVENIDGGHRVTITDVNGPQSFDILDGSSSDNVSGVSSFNNRTGNVTPAVGDYSADQISFSSDNMDEDTVHGAIEKLFTSVSDGKELLASAVTDKGVETEKDASFQEIAENIQKIKTGESTLTSDVEILDGNINPYFADLYSTMNFVGIHSPLYVLVDELKALVGVPETAEVDMEVIDNAED